MDLYTYPRPEDDTGIGIHWVTGYPAAVGISRIREYWLPELKALGVKWVKLPNHDGALDLVELLLVEGIMPVVRLFRPNPNPGRLGVRELVYVDSLIRAGVHYFEFNHEPDKDAEWKGGRVPKDALQLVVEDTAANMEMIMERGGMPGLPALSGGSSWDLVGALVEAGHRELLDGPVWQAIHNFPRNRPLDYPYDIGNQEGAAYTERFYQVVAEEEWGEHAWRGRSLYEVNRLRLGRANPGATTNTDHDCWLAYEHFDSLNRRHLGRSLPILSTACGYIVGEDTDPRYPAVTPDLHMAQTLEACRSMMGTSQRYDPAPEYYFCTAFWLIANRQLGSSSDWWEGQAWYSDRRPGGVLPIVPALRAEPKIARRRHLPLHEKHIALRGAVHHAGERRTMVLEQDGRTVAQSTLDADDRYLFPEVAPGHYTLRLAESSVIQDVTLTAERENVVLNFDLSQADASPSNSIVRGDVRGGAGAVVMLVRRSDGEEWITLAREDGTYTFVDLPAGCYSVRIHPNGARMDDIGLDGRNERRADLAVYGWGHTVNYRTDDPRAHAGAVRCTVDGQAGAQVTITNADDVQATLATGSNPEFGTYTCEFTDIPAGDYLIRVADVPLADDAEGMTTTLEARVSVDRKRVPEVLFVRSESHGAGETNGSRICGSIRLAGVGDARATLAALPSLEVAIVDGHAQERRCLVDGAGAFEFDGLAPGQYTLAVIGHEDETRRTEIALDGANTVEVDLTLSPVMPHEQVLAGGKSTVSGYVPGAAGALATLTDATGNQFTRVVERDGRFEFDQLAASDYELTIDGGFRETGLSLDGRDGVEVVFSPLIPTWVPEVSHGGKMPGFSVLRVDVEGRPGERVSVYQEDGEPWVAVTGEDGTPTVAEFKHLDAGEYVVDAEGVDAKVVVELTGLEALWVTFRRVGTPLNPNLVRRLRAGPGRQASGAPGEVGSIYLFVGRGLFTGDELTRVVTYAAGSHIVIGSDPAQAQEAARVAVIGDVDEEFLDELRRAGVDLLLWPWPDLDQLTARAGG